MLPVSLACPFFVAPSIFSRMDKPEKLATLNTQDTGQINVREY
jgi:hypothetical protein